MDITNECIERELEYVKDYDYLTKKLLKTLALSEGCSITYIEPIIKDTGLKVVAIDGWQINKIHENLHTVEIAKGSERKVLLENRIVKVHHKIPFVLKPYGLRLIGSLEAAFSKRKRLTKIKKVEGRPYVK